MPQRRKLRLRRQKNQGYVLRKRRIRLRIQYGLSSVDDQARSGQRKQAPEPLFSADDGFRRRQIQPIGSFQAADRPR